MHRTPALCPPGHLIGDCKHNTAFSWTQAADSGQHMCCCLLLVKVEKVGRMSGLGWVREITAAGGRH